LARSAAGEYGITQQCHHSTYCFHSFDRRQHSQNFTFDVRGGIMVDILSVFWIVLDREWTSATALAQRGSAKGSAGAEAETGTVGWTDLDEIYEIETMCHTVDRKSPDSIFGWCSSWGWSNLKAIWLYTPGFQDEKEPSDMFTIVHHIK
jgi:hypothetical protein